MQWIGGNWLTALLVLLVIGAIFYWLSKMVGGVLLVVAVAAAFFYAQRVGAGDRSADQAVKAALQKGGEASRQVWQKLQTALLKNVVKRISPLQLPNKIPIQRKQRQRKRLRSRNL